MKIKKIVGFALLIIILMTLSFETCIVFEIKQNLINMWGVNFFFAIILAIAFKLLNDD
jgi:hypothetical protein